MTLWGPKFADNDVATSWVRDTIETTGLRRKVEEALELTSDGNGEGYNDDVIRAAAYLFGRIGEPSVWPHDSRLRIQKKAISRLTELIDSGSYSNFALASELKNERTKIETLGKVGREL